MTPPRGIKLVLLKILALLVLASVPASAQEAQVFEAAAAGTGQQRGMKLQVQLILDSNSSPQEQQVLVNAFVKDGDEGLIAALENMPVRGKLWVTNGRLGVLYDVGYSRQSRTQDGVHIIQVITKRAVTYPERERSAQPSFFDVSAVQLILSPEEGKSTGVFMPSCQFSIGDGKGIYIKGRESVWSFERIVDRSAN